ncbi:MAG: fatty acid desaturase family protein [Planctomycetota bacterium]
MATDSIPADSPANDSPLFGAELTGRAAAQLKRFSRTRHIETVRRLSRVSGLRSVLLIAGVWVPLIAVMAWAVVMPRWWVYLIAACVVGSRQVAMGVLVHDAVHYSLFKNRLANDVIADLFLAFPIGMSTGLYRKTHLQHHRYTNTEDDCDLTAQREDGEWFEWPKNAREFRRVMLRSLLGLNLHRGWIMFKHWAPWNHLRDPITPAFPLHTRVLYLLNMAAVYAALGWGFSAAPWETLKIILLFMIPGTTLVNFAMRLRATAEHIGADNSEELRATRTVLPHWWERWIISPVGVNYHLEHHLFPSVPGPKLAELHRELMTDQEYHDRAHVTHGYDGVLKELMADSDATVGG